MGDADEDGDYMNYRVKMDNSTFLKINSEPEEALKDWIQTYLHTGAQLQFRELSECERAKQLENRFRLQNLFSERTLPPQGVEFTNDEIIDEKDDGVHRTYVERFVFVAQAKGVSTKQVRSQLQKARSHLLQKANAKAIENFRVGLAEEKLFGKEKKLD